MKLRYYLRGLGMGIIVTALIMGIAGNQREQLTDEEIRTRAAMLGMVDGGTVLSGLVNASGSGDSTDIEIGNSNDQNQGQMSGSGEGTGRSEEDFAGSSDDNTGNDGNAENDRIEESGSGRSQNPEQSSNTESGQSGGSGQGGNTGGEQTVGMQQGGNSGTEQSGGSGQQSGSDNTEDGTATGNGDNTDQSTGAGDDAQSTDGSEFITFTIQRGASSEIVSRNLAGAGLIDDVPGFNAYLVENGYSRVISVGTYQIPVNASWLDIAQIITRRRQ